MKADNHTGLIYKAYKIIGNRTPIRADCGKLCGKACCKGETAGMLLFPGEDCILEGVPGFSIEETDYMETAGVKLLRCEGRCSRDTRPLSCRIFPVAPDVGEAGSVGAQPDIRGRRVCPIWDLEHVDTSFIKSVEKAFALLSEDKEMLAFMGLVSSDIKFLRRFYK